jgi:hypothetical protein
MEHARPLSAIPDGELLRRLADVARASREHPILLDMLVDGRLHLTGIARLVPHLTTENRAELLGRAMHKSRRQIEELIAEIAPRADAPALMRRLPVRQELAAPAAPVGAGEAALAPPQLCPDRVEMGSLALGGGGALASVAPTAGTPEAIRPAVIQPLGSARYRVQFTASAQLHDKLERLRAAVTWTKRVADVRSATASSTTIGTRSASGATTAQRTSA